MSALGLEHTRPWQYQNDLLETLRKAARTKFIRCQKPNRWVRTLEMIKRTRWESVLVKVLIVNSRYVLDSFWFTKLVCTQIGLSNEQLWLMSPHAPLNTFLRTQKRSRNLQNTKEPPSECGNATQCTLIDSQRLAVAWTIMEPTLFRIKLFVFRTIEQTANWKELSLFSAVEPLSLRVLIDYS